MSTRRPVRPRRVLMTADTLGGVWTYAIELSRAFNASGIEVVLATMGRRLDDAQRADVEPLSRTVLAESEFALEWMADPWRDVDEAGRWLLDVAQRTSPDVVHLSSMSHGALDWRSPVVVVAHSCVLSWWAAVRRTAVPDAWQEYTCRVRRGLRAADLVVAPSRAMLNALDHHYGPLLRTGVVWNGRAPDAFAPAPKAPLVLGAGRVWDPAKNLLALDRAARRVPWRVAIAGERTAPHGETVSTAHAEWLGVLDAATLRSVMARASIYALPARYEPFGLSVLEAALSGCALVLGDIPSLREIWGEAALFVPPDDDAALADGISRLIDDDAARAALGSAARVRAVRLTPARMAHEYLARYGELALHTAA